MYTYTDDINTSEEWLRYIESKAIMQKYDIIDYSDKEAEEKKEQYKENKDKE